MQMDIMGIFGENVIGFDKIGYQRKEAVISSFAEYIKNSGADIIGLTNFEVNIVRDSLKEFSEKLIKWTNNSFQEN